MLCYRVAEHSVYCTTLLLFSMTLDTNMAPVNCNHVWLWIAMMLVLILTWCVLNATVAWVCIAMMLVLS